MGIKQLELRARFAFAAMNFLAILIPCLGHAQDSPGFTFDARYDSSGRKTAEMYPDPDGAGPLHNIGIRYTYDSADRLTSVEEGVLGAWPDSSVAPADWSSFTVNKRKNYSYDAFGHKISEKVINGATYLLTQYSYDALDRLVCTVVRMDPTTSNTDACVPGTSASFGPDRVTKNIYDAAGRLVQVRKAVGTGLEQAYVTYSYTLNDKREYVVDANGNKARLIYDGHDRQALWQFPSVIAPASYNSTTPANAIATSGTVNTNDYEAYGYDSNGNRTSFRKRDARTFSFGYDALNRMTSKIVPDACVSGYACTSVSANSTRDVYYSYDLRGLQTAARFDGPSGSDAVINDYDGFGRLVSSATSMGGISRGLGYKYDADGNRTRLTYPDGNFFTYAYDGLNRPTDAYESGLYQRVHFDWDNQGRRWGEWRGSVFSSYGFDQISRLASVSHDLAGSAYDITASFIYNPANQIVSRTRTNNGYAFPGYVSVDRAYAANGLNQYANVGGNSFTYDANGNLIADGVANYAYDAENRLVATSAGTALVYDPIGRLYQVYRGGVSDTRFLYDGDQLTVEYDGSGNLLRRYLHGTGEDDPLLWYEGPGLSDLRSMQVDQQGSIVSVADAGGNALGIYRYDEYGIPGANQPGRFQYTGQAWLPELGMYYYKARIYSPTLGRFLQTDPIGYKDQINLYAYVADDPINGRDPTGMCGPFCPLIVAAIAENGSTILVAAGIATAATVAINSQPTDCSVVLCVMVPGSPRDWDGDRYIGPYRSDQSDAGLGNSDETPDRTADDPLRRGPGGEPEIDPEAAGRAHTQLGTKTGRRSGQPYRQGREFDEDGNPVRDIHHSDHGYPDKHANPHEHVFRPNETGGTPKRGRPDPF